MIHVLIPIEDIISVNVNLDMCWTKTIEHVSVRSIVHLFYFNVDT